jgi:hypothetical protein
MKDLDREANLVPLCLYSQPGYPPPPGIPPHFTPLTPQVTPCSPRLDEVNPWVETVTFVNWLIANCHLLATMFSKTFPHRRFLAGRKCYTLPFVRLWINENRRNRTCRSTLISRLCNRITLFKRVQELCSGVLVSKFASIASSPVGNHQSPSAPGITGIK